MIATGHQIEESIDQLAAMIEGAKQMAESGQMVELDALSDKERVERPNPLVAKLERLMDSLNHLEITLRKRNVNLALDLQQADRRLRAQVAYQSDGTDS